MNARNQAANTPLHHAISQGNPLHVGALLNAGADANALNESGDSPLHLAASRQATAEEVPSGAEIADEVLDLIEPTRGWLASRQPSLRHEILDLRALAAQGPTEGSVVSWLASMELDSSAANITRVVREVLAEYPGAEHARLREAFREWILGAAETWGIKEEVLEQVRSLKEAGMIYAGVEELKERAHREGLGQGRAEGRTTMVCRLARLKFGAGTADRLSRLLEEVSDPDQIARIGDRIIECETGEELLARAREA